MSALSRAIKLALDRADLETILKMAQELSDALVKRTTPEQRAEFVLRFLEENLPRWLSQMDREQKAELMNSLLPLLARYFPLEDLDILGVFGKRVS